MLSAVQRLGLIGGVEMANGLRDPCEPNQKIKILTDENEEGFCEIGLQSAVTISPVQNM